MAHAYERLMAEQQPDTRRRLGVYYTPDYIVHYIVRQTVEKRLETYRETPLSTL